MKRDDEPVTLAQAIYCVIHGSNFGEHRRFPLVDMMIVLDILGTLARYGKMPYKQISSRLNGNPNRETVRKYLKILHELGLISVVSQEYRGVARAKKFFEVNGKGREFVSSAGRILSR